MAMVDVERGRADAAALGRELSNSRGKSPERGSPRRSSFASFHNGDETEELVGEADR